MAWTLCSAACQHYALVSCLCQLAHNECTCVLVRCLKVSLPPLAVGYTFTSWLSCDVFRLVYHSS